MIALLSLLVWIYLCCAHGKFWISAPELAPAAPTRAVPDDLPDVDIVVPARDEAQYIGATIASLLAQEYPGRFRVILVDDNSTDGTAQCAGSAPNLSVIRGQSKPAGWSGKLWALHQGVAAGSAAALLFTDADIVHDPRHLSALVARLQAPRVDLVSEMVRLNCRSLAERALVPAFVYFFQMLYPFARVNAPGSRIAAAAGGTMLIRREALQRIGGIESIKHALIDDVALAKAVKAAGAIYLGHSALAASIRPYPHFVDVWRMISRTAFTQLRCSAALLALTLLGLTLVWLVPTWAMVFGHGRERGYGLGAVSIAAITYLPTLARYGRSRLWSLLLPLIALFYMAATMASAVNHWRGVGAHWKDRAYGAG
jgi:hopene-associated glycosyltransferase HpnB